MIPNPNPPLTSNPPRTNLKNSDSADEHTFVHIWDQLSIIQQLLSNRSSDSQKPTTDLQGDLHLSTPGDDFQVTDRVFLMLDSDVRPCRTLSQLTHKATPET